MRKKLLVLTDFSKNSWNAIQYAVRLYEQRNCDFYILNTYRRDSLGFDSIALDPDAAFNKFSENRSKEGLGAVLERILEIDTYVHHHFYAISRSGPLLAAVRDFVQSQEIDLIFMGARGMDNEQKKKYGNNTLDVIQNIRRCPVMVVPKIAVPGPPKEIVLVTNFQADFDFLEMEHLAGIARLTKAKIKVFSLADIEMLDYQQKKNKLSLRRHFEGVDFSFHTLRNKNIEDAVQDLEIGSSNIFSYIHKKPTLWERLGFGQPMLGKFSQFRDVPVLALHG